MRDLSSVTPARPFSGSFWCFCTLIKVYLSSQDDEFMLALNKNKKKTVIERSFVWQVFPLELTKARGKLRRLKRRGICEFVLMEIEFKWLYLVESLWQQLEGRKMNAEINVPENRLDVIADDYVLSFGLFFEIL